MSVVCVLLANGTLAAELGNPAQLTKKGQFDVGFQWTSAFNQGFEDYDLHRAYSDGATDTARKEADFENDQYYAATVIYGILDQLNVFAILGMVDGGKWLDYESGNVWKGNLDSQFVWSVGAKGRVYEFGNGLGFGLAGPVHALRQPEGQGLAMHGHWRDCP